MAALKDAYPLYLANEAQTPNLDLEVTDKYTGKVATRVTVTIPPQGMTWLTVE